MLMLPSVAVEHYSTIEPDETHKSSGAPFSGQRYYATIPAMGTHIRERIRAARLHAMLTQEQLGERIGVSKSAVSMWETSNPKKWTRPTYENLQSLAKITGADIGWLINDNSEIHPDWSQPAELVEFPKEAARPPNQTDEVLELFSLLDAEERAQILAYLRTRRGMTKG